MRTQRSEIAEIVGLQLGRRRVLSTDRLQEDLGADSADLLNLVVALEDRFDITISEEQVAGLQTVEDVERLVAGEG